MINRIPRLALAALSAGTLMVATGCGPNTSVERKQGNEVIDISGKWNDADAEQVSQKMISEALSRPWLNEFIAAKKRNPKVRLSEVKVRTNGDTVSTAFFMKAIEDDFINSGKISVIQSKEEAALSRSEIDDATKHSANNTPEAGKENAGDFILRGEITVQDDIEGQRGVKAYAISLNLTNIQSGDKVWQKTEKIKKYVEKKNARW